MGTELGSIRKRTPKIRSEVENHIKMLALGERVKAQLCCLLQKCLILSSGIPTLNIFFARLIRFSPQHKLTSCLFMIMYFSKSMH